jgi:hypothetical protein
MSARKKLLALLGLLATAIIASLIIFAACDKRKALNPVEQNIYGIELAFSHPEIVVYSSDTTVVVDLGISVVDVEGQGLDSVQVTVTRTPEIGTISPPQPTAEGYTTARYQITQSVSEDFDIIFTVRASSVSATDTLHIYYSNQSVSLSFDNSELVKYNPNVIDTIQLRVSVMDENGTGVDEAVVRIQRDPSYGIIVQPPLTANGNALGYYITDANINTTMDIVFTVASGRAEDTVTLHVVYPDQAMYMNFTPPELVIYNSNITETATINIWLRDEDGGGINGVPITLSRTPAFGTIIQPGVTEDGLAQGSFIMDPGYDVDTSITFTARSVNGTYSYIRSLNVLYSSQIVSISLRPRQLVIYSVNKPDTAAIDIWVRNEDGSGINDLEVWVTRTPEIGSIVPPPPTVNGFAEALFITEPGNLDYTEILFTALTGASSDTATLIIIPSIQGEIGDMNISLQKSRLTANGSDKTNVNVAVIDTTGVPIGDGTPVRLEHYGSSTPGQLIPASGIATTGNGVATFELTAPSNLDPALIIEQEILKAWAVSLSGDTTFAYDTVTYVPGQASRILIPDTPDTMMAGSQAEQQIMAVVTDENENFVIDGTHVQFKKDLATSSITQSTTTDSGHVVATYTVGTESGTDHVRAFIKNPGVADTLWSNSQPIHVVSNTPSQIRLTTPNAAIPVGGYSTNIYAHLQDANGNPLSSGYGVVFKITAAPSDTAPSGPSFDSVITDTGAHVIDSVLAVTDINGRAGVAVYSGTKSGTVRIKAISTDNPNIFKEKSLVTLVSGPPAHIDIGPTNLAQQNGDAISTPVICLVWDQYSNQVECSTAVYFTLIPDTIAYIYGNGITGGCIDSATGDTIGALGQVTTSIVYTSGHTFDTVRVIAASGDIADTSVNIVLAIFEGEIVVGANPGYLFVNTPAVTADTSDIEALLIDGLGYPIENGVINFSVQICGEILGPVMDTTDIQGMAYTRFRIWDYQIPQTPPEPPQCTAKVKARLRGYADVEGETEIYCSRPQ